MGSEAPYPQSDTIIGLTWDDSVIRTALGPIVNQETGRRDGSDNWPITWADDGDLYVTYGDGYGFEPYLKEKRGIGFARISGDPETGRRPPTHPPARWWRRSRQRAAKPSPTSTASPPSREARAS